MTELAVHSVPRSVGMVDALANGMAVSGRCEFGSSDVFFLWHEK